MVLWDVPGLLLRGLYSTGECSMQGLYVLSPVCCLSGIRGLSLSGKKNQQSPNTIIQFQHFCKCLILKLCQLLGQDLSGVQDMVKVRLVMAHSGYYEPWAADQNKPFHSAPEGGCEVPERRGASINHLENI